MKVEQIMKQAVRTCSAHDSLDCIAQSMWETDCGCAPVVDAENRVVGMITDRDICMAAYSQGKALRQLTVEGSMAKRVYCCKGSDSIAEAERVMQANQVRRLPVVDEGNHLVGIVSLNDIATEAQRTVGRGRSKVLAAVGETLAAIGQPHPPHAVTATGCG